LEIRARFDLDDPVARKADRLVRTGAIKALSIGYTVRGWRRARDSVRELLDVDLHEVSLVMNPANERALILAVKADDESAAIEAADVYREWRDRMLELSSTPDQTGEDALYRSRKTIPSSAVDPKPITIASFEC
jgi:phage head maturation protease